MKPVINPIKDIGDKLAKLTEFYNKLLERSRDADAGSATSAVEISGVARVIAYCATDISKAAMSVATLADVKQQSDYEADQHAQKSENFLAVLQQRTAARLGRAGK